MSLRGSWVSCGGGGGMFNLPLEISVWNSRGRPHLGKELVSEIVDVKEIFQGKSIDQEGWGELPRENTKQ